MDGGSTPAEPTSRITPPALHVEIVIPGTVTAVGFGFRIVPENQRICATASTVVAPGATPSTPAGGTFVSWPASTTVTTKRSIPDVSNGGASAVMRNGLRDPHATP